MFGLKMPLTSNCWI